MGCHRIDRKEVNMTLIGNKINLPASEINSKLDAL